MARIEPSTTTLSTKGQIIVPKPIRQALGWKAGEQLIVERTPDGVQLKPVPAFPRTRIEDVAGCLVFRGRPKSLAEMDAGVMAEARRRHAGD